MNILFRMMLCLSIVACTSANATEPLLHRGIALSNWLANAKRQPVDARDMAIIAQAGFDHVRLPIDPESLDFKTLDDALALAENAHLHVILDIHPSPAFMRTLETQAEAEDSFVALWQLIARHYATTPPEQLSFELLNEPQYYKNTGLYNVLIQHVIDAIRIADRTRILIIDAPWGASLAGLEKIEPFKGDHLLYAFHFYEPYIITHQGIHQGFEGKMVRHFSHVPYPASLATQSASDYAPTATDSLQAEDELDEYKTTGWNAERINQRIALAKAWADKYHARIICTEFGALRHTNDTSSRYRWIADVRTALDNNHIGFSLWDYTDLFGITTMHGKTLTDPIDKSVRFVEPEQGTRTIDTEVLAALGLAQ